MVIVRPRTDSEIQSTNNGEPDTGKLNMLSIDGVLTFMKGELEPVPKPLMSNI